MWTIDEYEKHEDAESEQYCDLYNQIKSRPDGEIVMARALGILKILAEGPVEGVKETDWPEELPY